MIPGPWFRIPLVVFGVLVVHDAVLRGLRLDGVRPDLLLGLVVAGALAGGPERGALFGFVAGVVADLLLPTPLGMSALVWCLLGYTVGNLHETVLPQGRVTLPVTALVASASGEVLFALVGSVLGQPAMVTPHLATVAGIVAGVNAIVVWPLTWVVRWSLTAPHDERSFAA